MMTRQPIIDPARRRALAFTVVELMVAVSILSLIVFTLFKVFDTTQRALHQNITQVDVLESGRAGMELITRELQEMAPSGVGQMLDSSGNRLNTFYQANFMVRNSPAVTSVNNSLKGGTLRTNFVQDLFFLTRSGRDVTGIGYRVLRTATNSGYMGLVGSLFRFSTNISQTNLISPYFNLSQMFTNIFPLPDAHDPTNEFARVVDGVVHFRVQAYDAQGRLMDWDTLQRYSQNNVPNEEFIKYRLNSDWNGFYRGIVHDDAEFQLSDLNFQPEVRVYEADVNGATPVLYLSNALPAYVDIELGILESKTVERLKGFVTKAQAEKYMGEQAGRVHIFHQRVPIRASLR